MDFMDLGKTPISEQNPAGEDVRFEPDFEALTDELEKLSSPTASGEVDWGKVTDLCRDILAEQSKDLLVACYLCTALTRSQGWEGLETGVHVLRDLLETFWDSLFPPKNRVKGRVNALAWWEEKTRGEVDGLPREVWPKERRDRLLGDLDAVDRFLGENLDGAPMLHRLAEAVGGRLGEKTAEAPSPEPEAGDGAEEPGTESKEPGTVKADEEVSIPPAPSPPSPPDETTPAAGEDEDPETVLAAGLDRLARAADLLSQGDSLEPRVFRLNRIASWMSVESPPPADKGTSRLPAPDGQIISALERLHESGAWQDLLDAAESHVPQHLFWLDLSRYAAEAAENLNRPDVREAIETETRLYVQRLPGIERLRFSNGTPFADEDTREWLSSLGGDNRAETAPAPQSGSVEAEVAEVLNAARELAKANRLGEAVGMLQSRRGAAGAARDRFLWGLGLCRLLLQAGQETVAAPYATEILQDLEGFRLETWEPGLAVEALVVALKGLRGKEGDGSESCDRLLERIALLDPVKALDLT
jgi:type VI secretion system protein VasJ